MKTLGILLLGLAAVARAEGTESEMNFVQQVTPAVDSLLDKIDIKLGEQPNYLAQATTTQPSWWRRPDRVALALFSITPGDFTYEVTSGNPFTATPKTRAGMDYWRFMAEYFGGAELSYGKSNQFGDGSGRSAESFDLFLYAGYPNQPSPSIRFRPRFGFFYNEQNLKGLSLANGGGVEPYSWGMRLEVEGEVDIIKKKEFMFSIFASGRFGYGWGRSQVFGFGSESSTNTSWGWQIGIRLNINRFYVAVSYISREDSYKASVLYSRATYAIEGVTFSFGVRF